METKYIVEYKVISGSHLTFYEDKREMVTFLADCPTSLDKVEKIFKRYDDRRVYVELSRLEVDKILEEARLLRQTETVTFTLNSGEKIQYRGIKTVSTEMQTLLCAMALIGVSNTHREIEP